MYTKIKLTGCCNSDFISKSSIFELPPDIAVKFIEMWYVAWQLDNPLKCKYCGNITYTVKTVSEIDVPSVLFYSNKQIQNILNTNNFLLFKQALK